MINQWMDLEQCSPQRFYISNKNGIKLWLFKNGIKLWLFSKVRALISQMDDSEMMQPDFDMTTYINRLFPTEQSLAQLDVYMDKLDEEIVCHFLGIGLIW